jgi:two-component system chemotaxis sensor kinase CheA
MSDDPRDYFAVEARELLEGLTQGALHAARERTLGAAQRKHLLRLAHTLKGAARIVRETAVADGAHGIEDLIADAPESLPPEFATELLSRLDALQQLLPTAAGPVDGAPAIEDQGLRSIALDAADLDRVLARMLDMNARCAAIRQDLEAPGGAARAIAGLDALALELVDARDDIRQLRLAPAAAIFLALERAVHDGAAVAGVRARFTPAGGEHRLDAAALATVRDALVQLVRNAVAHGIESPGARLAAGKPAEGTVALRVEQRGADVAFVVHDDGRGIDFDALRRTAPSAAPLSDDALIDRLLAGGLTSRQTASQLAGRGVGLDVARSAVARLNGRLTLQTQPGAGVTFEIIVPASIRSLPALRVEAGHTALVPLESVARVLSLHDASFTHSGRAREIVVDGQALPVVRLRRMLDPNGEGARQERQGVAVLVRAAAGTIALAVERVRESATVIVESLPALSGAAAIVRGLAVDDRGVVIPVLEPDELAAFAVTDAETDVSAPRPARHVLVVDDSVTTRMLEQSILEAAGYHVDTAVSGEDALDRITSAEYDLLIVDVEMPGMSGFDLLERLREDDRLARLPAMLVSSRSSEHDRRRGRDAGARAYIVKGEFDQDVFLRTVETLVG